MGQTPDDAHCNVTGCRESGNPSDSRIQRIYEYLDGVLSHSDIEDVQGHLNECEECSAEYDVECIIRSVVRRSCTEKAPESLKSKIMVRISEIRAESSH